VELVSDGYSFIGYSVNVSVGTTIITHDDGIESSLCSIPNPWAESVEYEVYA
jgi:hypothetical protein